LILRFAVRSAQFLLLASLLACASKAPPVQPPSWPQLPGPLVDAVCSTLQNEGISPENLVVVKTTQPLVTGTSLRSVGHVYGKDVEVGSLAQMMNAATTSMPLALSDSRCPWKAITKLDPLRNRDQMVVEFSSPISNPFVHNEAGVMARMSLGGHESQWYWIPLGQKKGEWAIGIVLPMDMHE